VAKGLELIRQGADILDIGGESTRPGALPVPLEEELRRVVPVIKALALQTTVPLSVDTSKAEVARASLAEGAHAINDVTALAGDPAMPGVIGQSKAGVILMHMKGTPRAMQQDPHYEDPVGDIARFLLERLRFAENASIPLNCIALDPGIGFGKTGDHNLEILARLYELQGLARPI
jgi:dihydropteroate synthase